MIKFRILIGTFLAFNLAFAQTEDCECVTRSPFFYKDNFHLLLPIDQALTNRVDSILILLSNSTDSPQLYKSYELDSKGQLSSITEYYDGRPSARTSYIRESGRIIREEFVYLGDFAFGNRVTDYHYNQNGLLIKTQERGIRGEILPTEESNHTLYEYDNLNRLQYKKYHMYWGPSALEMRSVSETRYEYSDDGSFDEIPNISSDSPLIIKHILTSEGLPHKVIYPGADELFTYSDNGRILSYQLKNTSSFVDECPENSNYKDSIDYNKEGFIKTVRHEYSDKVCLMMLEYKKASNKR